MFRGIEIFFTLAAVVGGPLLAVMVVPTLAKRFLGKTPRWPGETSRAELDELRERVAELDEMSRRVAELEERVDFAERLLAQHREAGRLP